MPVPIGSSSIAVPTDVRSPDGYWFGGLYQPFRPITRLDPKALVACVAGFLPCLTKHMMVISPITLECFHVDEKGEYQLYIPRCELCYQVSQWDISDFREQLAKLLPNAARFKYAMETVTDLQSLLRHPAAWTFEEDMNFLTTFVAAGSKADFRKLDALVIDKNWASNPIILEDVNGTSAYWERQIREKKIKHATYETSQAVDLARFERNKLLHFNQLDPRLKRL